MTITHVVVVKFKDGVSADTKKEFCARFIGLKSACVSAESQQPYIKSVVGGVDNSIEGHQNGMTHAFIVEFASESDRDYYTLKDPAHLAFKQSVGELFDGGLVVDFTDGVF